MIADVRRNLSLRPERLSWDLRRFGFTPTKVARRIRRGGPPPVVCFSAPKAGTHLLERMLCLHPELWRPLRPTFYDSSADVLERVAENAPRGAVYLAHCGHTPEREKRLRSAGVRIATVVRDPRDIAVSAAHYRVRAGHPKRPAYESRTLRDRIAVSIRGDENLPMRGLRALLEEQLGWLEAADAVVRFESLVGPEEERRRAVADSLSRIGVPAGPELTSEISSALVSSASPTFRRGTSGDWRQHFDPELRALFEAELGDSAGRYGYEIEEAGW